MAQSTAVANPNAVAVSPVEQVLIGGDLAQLSAADRLDYYQRLCDSLGLNSLTRPFQYVPLNGKLVLYATRDCTEQLRQKNGISITGLEESSPGDGLYRVKAYARDANGKTDEATGVVHVGGLKAEALANAMMKAETKAKRRVTLSICGLGVLDETEIEDAAEYPRPTSVAMPQRASDRAAADPEPAQLPAPKDEPAISRFWRDVRAMAITRDQVVEHLGHEAFETLDDDALGELVIQLRDKFGKSQPGLGV